MERKSLYSISALGALLTIAVLLSLVVLPVLADPKYMKEGDGVGVWHPSPRSNSMFVQLTDKDVGATWNPIELTWFPNNGVYGWIHYEIESEEPGVFSGSIALRTNTPNTWYLVTFWAWEAEGGTILSTSTNGLFGGYSMYVGWKGDTLHWTDIALVKTDEDGRVSTSIPTAGGLMDCWPYGEGGCVPYIDETPTLASGTYDFVHVDVKYVGASADGTTPDTTRLMNPGSATLQWLFEWAPLSFEVT